jgi:uncharacterized protein (DUF2252 family)
LKSVENSNWRLVVAKAKSQREVQKPRLTREERKAAGKALREKVSRKSHNGWTAHPKRSDPVDLLIESSEGRLPQLLPIRYGRMMQTPFTFYRGAAAIMAADLAHTPASGIRVQACGDCHLLNFGAYGTPERRIVFDINDFDETLPAPWEWDVKRLAASFVIAARNNGFNKATAHDCAERSVKSYRDHMRNYAEMRVLDRWYEHLDLEDLIALLGKKGRERQRKRIAKEVSRNVVEDDFPKLASLEKGHALIKDNPPLIFHQSRFSGPEFIKVMHEAFSKYRDTLSDDRKVLLDHYEIRDTAVKVVGVGSVGTRCGIILVMAGDDDPLFLQVKEARVSVLEPYAGKSIYPNRGQRVVAGQRLMQSASDIFLGWAMGREGRHFYVRQLRDIKIKPIVEVYDQEALSMYAEFCGWGLARAHAKSGDPAIISGYLGNNAKFDEAIASFAVDYADQNERDHDALLKAVRAGKIDVYREQ